MLLAACGNAALGTTTGRDTSSTGHAAEEQPAPAATKSVAATALYEIYVKPPSGADSVGDWGRTPGQAYARRLDAVTRAVTAEVHLGPSTDTRMLASGPDTVQVFRDDLGASSLGVDVVQDGSVTRSWSQDGSPGDVAGVVNGYPCQQASATQVTCGLPSL
ncbi:MAG: hypothetical protein ACRDRL_07840, partial [Sciscionella sp.]